MGGEKCKIDGGCLCENPKEQKDRIIQKAPIEIQEELKKNRLPLSAVTASNEALDYVSSCSKKCENCIASKWEQETFHLGL